MVGKNGEPTPRSTLPPVFRGVPAQDAGDLARLSLGYAGRLEGDGVVQLAIAWSRWGAPEELRQAEKPVDGCDIQKSHLRDVGF